MAAELGHLARRAAAILCLLIFHVAPSYSRAQSRISGGTGVCISRERDALLSLKADFLDPAGRLSTWRGEHCCRWKGVRCSNRTGHVVKLDLRNTDDDYDKSSLTLSGDEMSPSLAALQQLRYLDLSVNDFNSTNIPVSMGSLENLRYLNLSSSVFSGKIPSQLGNLSNLEYLDVSWNDFDLHTVDLAWLSHLSLLSNLDMSYVSLHDVRGWVPIVNMLASLKMLRLVGCDLTSTVSATSKSNLSQLEVLDLSSNSFHTSLQHNWFWDLPNLKELYLSTCGWRGSIPEELGNMTSLQVIDLNSNLVVGLIPGNLENLCHLEVLHFEYNNINASIGEFMDRLPWCSWSTIQVFSVSYNNMTGELPIWIGNMTSLSVLAASRNMITGTVPLGLGALGNLTVLDLSYNKLNGVLTTAHFLGLLNLEYLLLSPNSLKMAIDPNWVPQFSRLIRVDLHSCRMGPHFPKWLRWQTNIDYLDLSNTNLDDVIPDWFGVTFSQASYLDASGNKLRGSLPVNLQHMSANYLKLGSNKLTGQVPHLPINILEFDLSSNSFSGSLPSELKGPHLQELLLANNQITGTIPSSMCQMTNLVSLDLSGNNLTGYVMQCWKEPDNNSSVFSLSSAYQFGSSMIILALSNNDLSGEFPKFLQRTSDLEFLDLSYNRFSGTLPKWLEKMAMLRVLMVRSNMFSGDIPWNLTCLESLHHLDIAGNNISGMIPSSVSSLEAMKVISYIPHGYLVEDNIPVTTKGQTRNYTYLNYDLLVNLDLSCNSLTGQIPDEISLLIGLTNMNLSSNQLGGEVPNQIGDLKQLESLDLSYNKLSGEIPSGLSALTSLSYLNFSYNNLSGTIPSGPQLQVLDNLNYTYIGNPGLCGYPLAKNCSTSTTAAEQSVGHEDADDVVPLYLGMCIGFVVGLWTVFCTMLARKAWAIAYFQIIDKLYNKVYVWVAIASARLTKKTHNDAM